MAGGGIAPTGKSGRKSLDAAINLVPFIDLLSCCLSFLLITAVWSQLAAIPAGHGGMGGDTDHTPPEVRLTLHVRSDGFLLEKSNGDPITISASAERRDLVQLAAAMDDIKRLYPDKQDITLHADDAVAYERVITTMDVLRSARFPAIHVAER
jgi:biopolymer transport protein TolR